VDNDESAPADAADGRPGMPADGRPGMPGDARVLPRVTSAVVRIYKEQFGRGPVNARTYYAGNDTLICLLADTLTPVERSMRDIGEQQRLRDIRLMFQYAAEDKFRAAVEEATGRRVLSFMSALDVVRDLASEIFILEP
jgi:uncharacterized protein YbcI